MKTRFKAGQRVDILISDVEIDEVCDDGTVTIVAEGHGQLRFWRMPPQAAIKVAEPKGWPPAWGDVWTDRFGHAWFAMQSRPGEVLLQRDDGVTGLTKPRRLLDDHGPLALAYRKPVPEVEVPF